ncbi:AEC family transporter [Cognatishimia sp. WU-CL00825]|uniref:AEC family transporter n=1 Tax=Cognatishimia sp. WU-CL00825 TaxID=3127658 RepID=UPI00310B48E5
MAFHTILIGLIPSFCLVILGGLLRNRLSENAWQGLDRLNFEILFPALLFVAASSRPISFAQIAATAPLVWGILIMGVLLGFSARRFGPERFLDFAGCWQTAWRFNTALGFVAIGALNAGFEGLFAVVVGMAVPVANVFAVLALSRGGGLGFLHTLKRVALNPFLLASVFGVMVGLSTLQIPVPILAPLDMLAKAAIPVALISIGAIMNWSALARLSLFSGLINATKLIFLPAIVCFCALISGTNGPLVQVLIVFAALPTASAAHVLASAFGARREAVATLIAQTTLLSAVTLPIWIAVAKLMF